MGDSAEGDPPGGLEFDGDFGGGVVVDGADGVELGAGEAGVGEGHAVEAGEGGGGEDGVVGFGGCVLRG